MSYSLDITSDFSHKELHSFLDGTTIPEFVKSAEVFTKEAASSMNEEAFADRYHRAFPIDNEANTYLSNVYFLNKRAALEDKWGKNYVNEVENRINTAGELFKISEDLKSYNSSFNEKTASDYTEQCVSSIAADGQIYDLFPFKTAADLSLQADTFSKDIKNYPFSWRTKIASDFIACACDMNIEELPDLICKYGGQYFPDVRNIPVELTRRMNKVSSEKAKEQYKALIEKSAGVASRDDAMHICSEVYTIEKTAGVYDNTNLSSQLGDIVDKTFQLDLDKVAELLDVVKMGGQTFAMNDLKKISSDIYKQAFGFDVDVTKEAEMREVLPTMPDSDVALLRELSGVEPL